MKSNRSDNASGRVILVQLSDLHMGYSFLENVFARRPGWRAHDPLLCFALQNALSHVYSSHSVTPNDALWFVMTGDLTRFGLPSEFCIAHTFLCSELHCNHTERCGLNISKDRLRMIPGNHDQWSLEMSDFDSIPLIRSIPIVNTIPLRFIPQGLAPSVEPSHFPQSQWPTHIISPTNNFQVSLFGINSSSGFEGERNNLRARGDIASKSIEQLKTDIVSHASDIPTIRCVLCHHSLCYTEEVSGSKFLDGILPNVMNNASKEQILEVANDTDLPIHVFLTGHTHSFASRSLNSDDNYPFEFRCGSTLQAPATDAHQGFWVHEISLIDERISWDSYRYQWDGTRFNHLVESWFDFQVSIGT